MLLKKIILVVLFLGTTALYAQKIKSQATFRMLKTATTLLEAQQFEAAEEYFKKGLEKAIQFNDLYCQAFANEGLGNYYAKTELSSTPRPRCAIRTRRRTTSTSA